MLLQQSTDKNKVWNEPNPRFLFQACFPVQRDNHLVMAPEEALKVESPDLVSVTTHQE